MTTISDIEERIVDARMCIEAMDAEIESLRSRRRAMVDALIEMQGALIAALKGE